MINKIIKTLFNKKSKPIRKQTTLIMRDRKIKMQEYLKNIDFARKACYNEAINTRRLTV